MSGLAHDGEFAGAIQVTLSSEAGAQGMAGVAGGIEKVSELRAVKQNTPEMSIVDGPGVSQKVVLQRLKSTEQDLYAERRWLIRQQILSSGGSIKAG